MAESPLQQNLPNAYVYAIIVDGIVRYIGKGVGDRVSEHVRTAHRIIRIRSAGGTFRTSRFYNRLAKSIARGAIIESRIIASGLTEVDALNREIDEIARAPDEQLWNTFPGGNGFTSEWIRGMWRDPAYRASKAKKSRELWNDPQFRANQLKVRNSREHKSHMKKVLTKALSDPAVRQRMSDKKKDPAIVASFVDRMNASHDEQWRANNSAARHAAWCKPEYRAKVAAGRLASREISAEKRRALWATPEFRAKVMSKWTPEARLRASEAVKSRLANPASRSHASAAVTAKWRDPEYRARQMAARAKS